MQDLHFVVQEQTNSGDSKLDGHDYGMIVTFLEYLYSKIKRKRSTDILCYRSANQILKN